jgi:hypothetical protein
MSSSPPKGGRQVLAHLQRNFVRVERLEAQTVMRNELGAAYLYSHNLNPAVVRDHLQTSA